MQLSSDRGTRPCAAPVTNRDASVERPFISTDRFRHARFRRSAAAPGRRGPSAPQRLADRRQLDRAPRRSRDPDPVAFEGAAVQETSLLDLHDEALAGTREATAMGSSSAGSVEMRALPLTRSVSSWPARQTAARSPGGPGGCAAHRGVVALAIRDRRWRSSRTATKPADRRAARRRSPVGPDRRHHHQRDRAISARQCPSSAGRTLRSMSASGGG